MTGNPVYQKPLALPRLSASEAAAWLDEHPTIIAEADTDDLRHKKRLVLEHGMYKVLVVSYREMGQAKALAEGFGGSPVVLWRTFATSEDLAEAVLDYNTAR